MKLKAKNLIYAQIYIALFSGVLISEFHFPSTIKYISDIICVILLFMCFGSIQKKILSTKMKYPVSIIILLLIYCIINSIANETSMLLMLWAIRVTFRFYVFFICCLVVLKREDIVNILEKFEIIYFINFAVILFQYFFQGYKQDFLGGIFGIEQGCNGQLNLFIIMVLSLEVIWYLEKRIKLHKLIEFLAIAFLIAALSELKVFYIEIILIVIIATCIYKPSRKTFLTVGMFIIGVIGGLLILRKVFPESYAFFFDQKEINRYLSAAWINGIQVTRTTGIEVINKYFFQNNIMRKIFGLGFGKCEVSAFFSSEFANRYANTSYRQFTFAMQYLETGFVGLLIYVSFFISVLISIMRTKIVKDYGYLKKYICVLIPLAIINIWYNDSCKTEVAYVLFFLLSSVGVIVREERKEV